MRRRREEERPKDWITGITGFAAGTTGGLCGKYDTVLS